MYAKENACTDARMSSDGNCCSRRDLLRTALVRRCRHQIRTMSPFIDSRFINRMIHSAGHFEVYDYWNP